MNQCYVTNIIIAKVWQLFSKFTILQLKFSKSIIQSPRNIPITVQTVWVGKDYVRIDRKIEIDRSKMKFRPPPSAAMKTKEAIKFDGTEQIQKNRLSISHFFY